MKRFEFRLARVHDLRSRQLEVEQAQLQPLLAERRSLEAQSRALDAERLRAAAEASAAAGARAGDLAALAAWRTHLARQRTALAGRVADCGRRIEAHMETIRQAERRVRLLDRLAERQRAAWQTASDREIEALAAELYLARRRHR